MTRGSISERRNKPTRNAVAQSSIAKYLDKQIEALKSVKTQRQIAADIGYEKPNIVSMFKLGSVDEMKI